MEETATNTSETHAHPGYRPIGAKAFQQLKQTPDRKSSMDSLRPMTAASPTRAEPSTDRHGAGQVTGARTDRDAAADLDETGEKA